ncbi:metallophosphoesterase [Desulforhopalus sp. IMCC35007]|uniref:metallophosphoesterase family protein n=1 Tax=Desulforhopalus sp. IMCC35007 TaxID=2569543 RepID=UPI0010AE182D|nr:metallophosphoesterase family protein [Desulforhopalus sp. IMCC35007]TKB09045.1 metallophosphoesterase family protein [Desulforhopalus sp. IMCC35007]
MKTRILLISDIHGNYPALRAIETSFAAISFDRIINCGDSLVYAPFPNETLDWLQQHEALSILGNTDKKVIKLLKGKTFKKPSKHEKRIMYESTAAVLSDQNRSYIQGLENLTSLTIPTGKKKKVTIGIFHGSPTAPHEFLFETTEDKRFEELAADCQMDIVVTGHSHTPYHKHIGGIHFINPGSVGRMFDGNSDVSCAIMEISSETISVQHLRIPYDVDAVTSAIAEHNLPAIYGLMYKKGQKLN